MISLIASLGALVPGWFGKELSYKTAKVVGFGVLIVLLAILLGVGKCSYDRSVVNHYKQKVEAKAAPARETAAEQQVLDDLKNAKSEQEMNDVIENAPGGELSPAAHARACELFKRRGRTPKGC